MNDRQIFQKHLAQTSPFPLSLEITGSEGIYLIDKDGKKYADMISGIGVSIIGHRNVDIINAIYTQTQNFMHTMVYGEHIMSPQTQLAAFLTTILPPHLDNVYLVNSGTEAVEGALKIAKKYTGRTEIISCKNAYHGSTAGSAALMSHSTFSGPSRPHIPNVKHIEFNDFTDLSLITERTAAVVSEVIQAEAGVILSEENFLKALRQRCNQTDTVLILDEIQTGFGRTGKWFAFEHYGIEPDILLVGKGLGGGLPLAAFIANKKVMSTIADRPILGHITTFGGNPVCCAASLATLKYIEEHQLIQSIASKEEIIKNHFKNAPGLNIRIKGLFAAIQLTDFNDVQQVCNSLIEKGVLVDWFLFNDSSIRLAPPLTISEEELKENIEMIIYQIKSL